MKEEEVKIWQQIIKGWEGSKLSQKRYCKERDINYSTFKGWRYRLLGKGNNKITSLLGKLLPVKIKGEETNIDSLLTEIELKVNKTIIHIPKITVMQLKDIIGIL